MPPVGARPPTELFGDGAPLGPVIF